MGLFSPVEGNLEGEIRIGGMAGWRRFFFYLREKENPAARPFPD
jgi:hypothetical protein